MPTLIEPEEYHFSYDLAMDRCFQVTTSPTTRPKQWGWVWSPVRQRYERLLTSREANKVAKKFILLSKMTPQEDAWGDYAFQNEVSKCEKAPTKAVTLAEADIQHL